MVAKLSKTLRGQERRIPLGFGVSFTFKPFTFAQYKEAEAWATRNAREGLSDEQSAALAGSDIDEMGDDFKDRLIGLASQMVLDRLVLNFCIKWEGVEEFGEDPEVTQPMELSPENWGLFRDDFPTLVELLDQQLRNPMHAVVTEGNGSAPSQNT